MTMSLFKSCKNQQRRKADSLQAMTVGARIGTQKLSETSVSTACSETYVTRLAAACHVCKYAIDARMHC